jgi:hypothetical protein
MESKPYLDWQWEGRPVEGEVVQCVFDDITLPGYWIMEDAGDREYETHPVVVWYVLANNSEEVIDMDGVPICWKPLDPPPPLEFGWEVGIVTAVYHNEKFSHNTFEFHRVIAPTADEAKALVYVPGVEEVSLSNGLTVKTWTYINSTRCLGRKVERVVVEFIKEDD